MINFSLYVFCQNKKKRKLDRREEYKGLSTSVQSDLLPKPEFICVKTLSLMFVIYKMFIVVPDSQLFERVK